jgi:hypothetical protein
VGKHVAVSTVPCLQYSMFNITIPLTCGRSPYLRLLMLVEISYVALLAVEDTTTLYFDFPISSVLN